MNIRNIKLASLLILTFLIQPAESAFSKGNSLSCEIVPAIFQGFLSQHYLPPKNESELEGRIISQYIDSLDPLKSTFLKSDIDTITAASVGMLQKLGTDCSIIDLPKTILIKRIEENLEFVKSVVNDSQFKFEENTEILLDSKQRKWPKTLEEAKEFRRKYIQFQIANYIASDLKIDKAKKQLVHRYELQVKRYKEIKVDEIYSLFVDAFANSLDAHSGFLGRDALEDFQISMQLSLEGIGASLTWDDGYTTVDSLIPGGAAERSNEVQPKDKIIAVGQGDKEMEMMIDVPLKDVVRHIRGKKGTTVKLSILRESSEGTIRKIVSLKRDKVSLEDEAARLVMTKVKRGDKEINVGIIDLPSFYGDLSKKTRSCSEDMKRMIAKAKDQKAEVLVLDLSKNGGGLLNEAVKIAGLFIKTGGVVATQSRNEKLEILRDEDDEVQWNGPLVVLTSRLSASASEIVSGALKDYHRAVIVGANHTFGKGTVQAVLNLPSDLGALKVTTGMFFIPGGHSTQYEGVKADVELPGIFSTKDIGEASLTYPLPAQKVSPFVSAAANDDVKPEWKPVESSWVKKLKSASEARVSKSAEFKKIKEELIEIEKKKGVINLAQSLKKQKEETDKDKKSEKKLGNGGKRKNDEEYLKLPEIKETIEIAGDYFKIT
ncbi:MAG: carboxy terminal-processing peptidase [Xanthomonadaceae bacterium]|nr:carboxy terminal-processing peptidase [Xanthomonadaceae bacterium]